MAEVRRKLISNTIYLLIGWIVSIFLNFVFQLFAAKTLMPEDFGILATVINFTAITSSILIFGMEQTTQRLTSYYMGKNKMEYLRSLLWFFLLVTVFLNAVTITGMLIFSSEISQLLKIPQNALFITIFALFPLSISFFLAGILRGYQNMRYLTITSMLGDFVKLVVAVSLVLLGMKFFGFLIGYLVAAVTILISRIKLIRLFITRFKKPDIGVAVKHAIPSVITQFFWLLLLNGQFLIISIIKNTYTTGLFAAGMVLSNQIYFIPRIISDALFPITSGLSANKNLINQQRNLLNLALRYSVLVSLPIVFFFSIFSKELILLIGRHSFLEAANLVPILITASLFFGIGTLLSRTLYAIGKTIVFQNISIASAILYIVISIILTQSFSSFGTAIAFSITSVFLSIVSVYYLKKHMSFNIDIWQIIKIFVGSLLTFGPLYIVHLYIPNLIVGVAIALISTLSYFFVLYYIGFYNENDIKILDFLSEKVGAVSKYTKILRGLISRKIQNKP